MPGETGVTVVTMLVCLFHFAREASVTGLEESIPFCVIHLPGTCFCPGSAQGRRLMGFMRGTGRPTVHVASQQMRKHSLLKGQWRFGRLLCIGAAGMQGRERRQVRAPQK